MDKTRDSWQKMLTYFDCLHDEGAIETATYERLYKLAMDLSLCPSSTPADFDLIDDSDRVDCFLADGTKVKVPRITSHVFCEDNEGANLGIEYLVGKSEERHDNKSIKNSGA